ncbi:MAG: hypothetical protein A2W68_01355 [Betaproteobacteria bacterium RIFCSPLOWO2_02_64_14]|nr:MAG: hypothetical protein A2W68_01355 [Betaproteobacteria bacterium RIFCSPLOWO2_02_64_14]
MGQEGGLESSLTGGCAMAHEPDASALAEEIAKLEDLCQKTAQAIASARSVREAVALADVDVPHHLRAFARVKVPSLGRLARQTDLRVEEIVKDQLSSLTFERSDIVASREFDRIKAVDWHVLRVNYPELYAKALREANLILERKRKR